jgi:hypothetical protein
LVEILKNVKENARNNCLFYNRSNDMKRYFSYALKGRQEMTHPFFVLISQKIINRFINIRRPFRALMVVGFTLPLSGLISYRKNKIDNYKYRSRLRFNRLRRTEKSYSMKSATVPPSLTQPSGQ